MSFTLRLEKGNPLTHTELDDNFKYPYKWRPTTPYLAGMLIAYNYNFYECITNHTSSTVFDASKWTIYSGSNELGKVNVIKPGESLTVKKNEELSFADNFYIKGNLLIEGNDPDSDFGYGSAVSTDGIAVIAGTIILDGTIVNDGKLIN